mmetsp:Transcript_4764/g.10102  ORF Transcript_4764/g.10102 Transcript_4764/m.10102 type:complete len:249 (-) Transcript_4764:3582-4328(-)
MMLSTTTRRRAWRCAGGRVARVCAPSACGSEDSPAACECDAVKCAMLRWRCVAISRTVGWSKMTDGLNVRPTRSRSRNTNSVAVSESNASAREVSALLAEQPVSSWTNCIIACAIVEGQTGSCARWIAPLVAASFSPSAVAHVKAHVHTQASAASSLKRGWDGSDRSSMNSCASELCIICTVHERLGLAMSSARRHSAYSSSEIAAMPLIEAAKAPVSVTFAHCRAHANTPRARRDVASMSSQLLLVA